MATSDEETPKAQAVLRPRFFSGLRGLAAVFGRIGIVVLLAVAVLLLPAPAGLSADGHRALAAFAFTAGILALQPVALPIAALLVPVALVALRVADTQQAFDPFSRPVIFLILGSLFLAEALRKHGLARRLALAAFVASGGNLRRLLFGLMGSAVFLSMWIENTATAAMLIPVALTIAAQVQDRAAAQRLLVLLILAIAYGASIGGMATIMGSASNAVASSFLSRIQVWTFVDWLGYGLPAVILIYPLTWWALVRISPLPITRLDIDPSREQLREMGPMTATEKEILLLLVATGALWIGGPSIEASLNLPPTLLSAAIVAVGAVAYLAIRDVISWDDLKGVSWGIIFVIGAGLSLGEALVRTGVSEWFATRLGPFVSSTPLWLSLITLVMLSALLTNLLNNATIAAVFVPVLIAVAEANPDFNATQLVLPVVLATTFGYSLPSASGRMALIDATGIVGRGEMFRYGLVVSLASSFALAVLFYLMAVVGWI